MKITRLVLTGYKRLLLNNIYRLVLTPESIYQLILGTNGSGKSSVLFELSPLPATAAHYMRDGSKEIDLEHRNSFYQLTSVFKSSAKHTFVKDGEELNPGGTAAVQKELVQQEFNITPDIHNLLIGKSEFTAFTPAKRREWLTALSEVDYTYALNVHKQLKSATRDAKGALSHVDKRLNQESNKLLEIGDVEALDTRYNELMTELDKLMLERDNEAPDAQRLSTRITNLLEEQTEQAKWLIQNRPVMPGGFEFKGLNDVDASLQEYRTQFEVDKSLRTRIAQERTELHELVEKFESAGVEDLASIKAQQTELHNEFEEGRKKVDIEDLENWEAHAVQRNYFDSVSSVIQVLQGLPVNKDRYYTRDKLKAAKDSYPTTARDLEKRQSQLARCEAELEHLLSLQHQECPKCGHRWIPGRSDEQAQRLGETKAKLSQTCEELEKKLQTQSDYIAEAEDYTQQLYSFRAITQQYPRLKKLWDQLLNDDRLLTDPRSLVAVVQNWGHYIERVMHLQSVSERLDKLNALTQDEDSPNQLKALRTRMADLDEQIESITQKLQLTGAQGKEILKYRETVSNYLETDRQLTALENDLAESTELLIRAYRAEGINAVIRKQQQALASLQHQLTGKTTLEGIIADLGSDRDSLSSDHELLGALSDALSPTDGLIAEQLTGFIQSFVAHVNQVIDQIWSYELKVLPCGLDSGDLDYKFPLLVRQESTENRPNDIAEGSEAQIEVVNLAFRLVTMVYLGLDAYPVYLDEAGASFDEQHRLNLLNFIKQLVDTGNHTQLFIISHYVASFNIYNNAEVLVLDPTNITVPKQYNVHASLE